jgi:hypothetical protein
MKLLNNIPVSDLCKSWQLNKKLNNIIAYLAAYIICVNRGKTTVIKFNNKNSFMKSFTGGAILPGQYRRMC